MKITANFKDVESGHSPNLKPGVYNVNIFFSKVKDTKSGTNKVFTIGVSALEDAGEQVGANAFLSTTLYKANTLNTDNPVYSQFALGVIKSLAIACEFDVINEDGEVSIDTDTFTNKNIAVKVIKRDPFKNSNGEWVKDRIEIKEFYPFDSVKIGEDVPSTTPTAQTFAGGKDVLDDDTPWDEDEEQLEDMKAEVKGRKEISKPKKTKAVKKVEEEKDEDDDLDYDDILEGI